MRCFECGGEGVSVVPAPGVLDESFGPCGHLLFVPTMKKVICPNCGEIGAEYWGIGVLCDVVQSKHHSRN